MAENHAAIDLIEKAKAAIETLRGKSITAVCPSSEVRDQLFDHHYRLCGYRHPQARRR